MKDYRDKIKKLLALAESPNENEAKAALLKARELMAEHKLTEEECREERAKKTVVKKTTIWTAHGRRNPWMIPLSATIGENYCCQAFSSRKFGQQTQSIGFIGFEDDYDVCTEIFSYAVNCILSGIKQIQKQMPNAKASEIKRVCDGYGYGFAYGVGEAFTRQTESMEEEYGLVLVMPKEVQAEAQELLPNNFEPAAENNLDNYGISRGFEDGLKFDPGKTLKPGEKPREPALVTE